MTCLVLETASFVCLHAGLCDMADCSNAAGLGAQKIFRLIGLVTGAVVVFSFVLLLFFEIYLNSGGSFSVICSGSEPE